MSERVHFNPAQAVSRLMNNEPPEAIFGEFFPDGVLPKLSYLDLAQSYDSAPNNQNPNGNIVAVLETAACADARIAYKARKVPRTRLPFSINQVVEQAIIDSRLTPLLNRAYAGMKEAISDFEEGTIARPHFTQTLAGLGSVIIANEFEARVAVSRPLLEGGEALQTGIKDYLPLIWEISQEKVPNMTFDQLLKLTVASYSILTIPASKNRTSMETYYRSTFEPGVNGVFSERYIRDSFWFHQTEKESRVLPRPKTGFQAKKEDEAEEDGNVATIYIKGCPAMRGGLIQATIADFEKIVRQNAKPEEAAA